MANEREKAYAKKLGIPFWKIAEGFHVSPSWFSHLLREEFSEEKAKEFRRIVDEIDFARRQEEG